MRRIFLFAVPLVALAAINSPAPADPKSPNYDEDLVPVLRQHCFNCHGNDKQKGGLNLATFAALKEGGSSGVVANPGDPDKSRLFTLSAHKEEPKMPPNNKIPDAHLAVIRTWIEQGMRENAGSKAIAVVKPKTDIALKSVTRGRPPGPPPMPPLGKLPLDPVVKARRSGAVLALAASPWAPVAAVGGQKQVLLYNTDSGLLVGVLPFDHGQINSLKFSRNAKFLLVAGGRGGQSGKAVLFNVETGAKVTEVGNETDAILAADISADQSQIAVGGPSKIIRVYSTADGAVLREIKKHTDWVTAVEFSPDGVLLATGDRNGGLFAWEAFTGREFFSLRGHTAMITDVSWRDDSNLLASASEDGSVRLWEMENGNQTKTWAAHGGGAAAVRFAHDGKLATTGRDRVTKLWDQNGTAVKQFDAFPDLGLRVAVTHDNAKVIAGDWSGVVKSWTAADAKVSAVLDANPPALDERVKLAQADVVAAEAKAKAKADALAAATAKAAAASAAVADAQAKAQKVAAELAAAQKAVGDGTAATKVAEAAVTKAKADVDAGAVAVLTAQKLVTDTDILAKTAADGAAKASAAAKAAPKDDALAKKAKDAAAVADQAAINATAAQKTFKDAELNRKVAQERHAMAVKSLEVARATVVEAQKRVVAVQPAVKPAADAVPPLQKAAADVAALVAPAKAASDAANAELVAARAKLKTIQDVAELKGKTEPKK